MNMIALDPGLSGAIARFNDNTITAQPFPIFGKALDLAALAESIRGASPSLAVIEKVGSIPGQG